MCDFNINDTLKNNYSVEGLIANDAFYKLCDEKKLLPVKIVSQIDSEFVTNTKKRKFGDFQESFIFITGRAIQELSLLINIFVVKEQSAKEKLQKSEEVLGKALKSSKETEDYIVHYIVQQIASQSLRYEELKKKLHTLKNLANKILLAKEKLPKPVEGFEYKRSFLDGWISRLIESNNNIN